MSKVEKKAVQEAINQSKSIEAVAERLGITLGTGADVLAQVKERIKGPALDAFEERHAAEDRGDVIEEAAAVEPSGDGPSI